MSRLSKKVQVKFSIVIPIIFLVSMLTACGEKSDGKTDAATTTFYLVRHAEKDRSNPENKNPILTPEGTERAVQWAKVLAHVELHAVYSTDYERTRMTAAPTAKQQNLEIRSYDPNGLSIAEFIKTHQGQNVLVVGHSNTTPEMTNRLLGIQKYSSMDHDDNGSLFIVRIVDGKATDMRLKIN